MIAMMQSGVFGEGLPPPAEQPPSAAPPPMIVMAAASLPKDRRVSVWLGMDMLVLGFLLMGSPSQLWSNW
ncbi:hypothetical protein [Nonomuraea aridisoli]|uniref:hypothetical protein n=1 Tax=Nonomuraea aridisoli TaxID=2070368 RepID=UPI001C64B6FB|nr:hypothetical protein [Nonomuraea aridisoli]